MRALVCDFDGLILDTETVVFDSWRSVYAEHRLELPRAEWVAAIGTSGPCFDPLAGLLDLVASEAVALEDSPNGVRAAKAAGLFCVAVPGPITRGLDFAEADRVLPSLAEWSLDDLLATRASGPPRGR